MHCWSSRVSGGLFLWPCVLLSVCQCYNMQFVVSVVLNHCITCLTAYVECLQFEHWRRPRGTLSSRQTTLLTAACTQTAKGARCPPSTAGPTPAPNQSRTNHPTERSCARSPARLMSRHPQPQASLPGPLGSPNRLSVPTSSDSS